MMLLCVIIGLIYLITIGILLIGTIQLDIFNFKEPLTGLSDQSTGFSILIPFRNEANDLPELLVSLKTLDYPLSRFEIIFIDDDSEDDSVQIINTFITGNPPFDVRLIENCRRSQSPKKDAITTAIGIAKHEWILTTDADCIVPKKWLQVYHHFILEHHPTLLAGPVLYQADSSFVQQYQQFDGLSLQGVTMGSFGLTNPILCNGANLGYLKSAFHEVKGFNGNDHLASGDDMFIMEKINDAFPNGCYYVKSKNAIVRTKSFTNWNNCIKQRIRWASKTSQQKNVASKLIGFIVLVTNLLVIIGGVLCFLLQDFYQIYLAFLTSKLFIDFIFLRYNARFFGVTMTLRYSIPALLLYPLITTWVVLRSFRGSYIWKGRLHKKF